MTSMRISRASYRQRGVALFVGLVFLVVISVVAVIAMRGTLMEMHMVNNVAAHESAFEVSESLRAVPVALFDDHTFNRGWPAGEMGGTVPDTDFGTYPQCGSKDLGSKGVSCTMLKAVKVRNDTTGMVNLYEIAYQSGEYAYDPTTWTAHAADMTITSGASKADIWIRPDGTALDAGNGAAQAAGYRGQGNGSASGGGSMYFEILSRGTVNTVSALTMSQYRQRITN